MWGIAGHLVGGAVVGVFIFKAYRYVHREARLLGAIMALGIVSRAAIGVSLFWISYLDLAFLQDLHSGDGFWALAPDARGYYAGALAYAGGAPSVLGGDAPPTFVKVIAAWMHLVGWSPASGLYFNVSIYALMCAIFVRACNPGRTWDAQIACAACLLPLSVAPVLLVHDSQMLKDGAFVLLIVVTGLSVRALLRVPAGAAGRPVDRWILASGLAAFGLAAFVISGMRLYFTALIGASLLPAAIVYVWRSTSTNRRRSLAVALALLAVAAIGPASAWSAKFRRQGAKASMLASVADRPSLPPANPLSWEAVVARVRDARAGFDAKGGASNIVAAPGTGSSLVRPALVGLAAIFVPISIVKAIGWADFPGGRGLLWITDVDTVLLGLSVLGCVALVVVRRRHLKPEASYVLYGASLAVVTGVLLACVVTNFGTLFRLRMMMAVPIWMLPLATLSPLSSSGDRARDP